MAAIALVVVLGVVGGMQVVAVVGIDGFVVLVEVVEL